LNKLFRRKLKITRLKILVAGWLYRWVRLLYSDKQLINRSGIRFEVDLREGIDLHLFLFGNFQKHVIENSVLKIPSDGIILDVGANFGIMSLFYAAKVPQGFVHAFEPTQYAYQKLIRNLDLNEDLKSRIKVNHSFVSSGRETSDPISVYSSWPVKGGGTKHEIHGGVKMSTQNASSTSLDQYCEDQHFSRVDLVKIDTDGHEFEVLQGMRDLLSRYQPQVIFEIGVYIMNEREIAFQDYCQFFNQQSYRMYTTEGNPVDEENFLDFIPEYGTIDLIAIPGQ